MYRIQLHYLAPPKNNQQKEVVRLRKMKPDDRNEMEMVLDTYKTALGLD